MRENIVQFIVLVLLCSAAGIIMLVLLYWGFSRLKKTLKNNSSMEREAGWTIEQINDLHKSGQLTDKQYRSLRDAIIRSADRRPSPGRSKR